MHSTFVPLPSDRRATRWLLFVLAIAIVVRLALVFAVRDVNVHTDDERDYTRLAENLLTSGTFGVAADRPTSIRPPLYPAFVAAVWTIAGSPSLTAVRLVQVALALAGAWLLFRLGSRMFSPRVGALAAGLWAFYPSHLYANVVILTEVLFTCFVLAAALCAARVAERPSRPAAWALLAGLAIGLAALTRSVLWPFPIVLAPALAWLAGGGWRRRASVAAAAVIGYLVVVAPWAARNTALQRTFVVVDTMGGLNLRMGNYEHTIESRMWDGVSLHGEKAWSYAMVQAHPEARNWTEGRRERWAREQAVAYMLAHPGTTARRAILKFADFWGLEREYIAALGLGVYPVSMTFAAISIVAVLASYVGAMLLAPLGAFAARWGDARAHLLPLLLTGFICGLHSIVFGHSRYHLPVMPFVLVYTAAALAAPWRTLAPARWRPAAIGIMWAILAGIWAHEVFVRDAHRVRQILAALS